MDAGARSSSDKWSPTRSKSRRKQRSPGRNPPPHWPKQPGGNWPQISATVSAITALVALAFTGLSFMTTRDQIRIAVNGQMADRFTTATSQLASDELEIRLGAIHALGRIAHDSSYDHPAVMEMLATFVQTHAPLVRRPGRAPLCTRGEVPTDVVMALSAIGHRNPLHDGSRVIDLHGTCLNFLDLDGADLSCVNLSGAHLENAILENTILTGALLGSARLTGANFLAGRLDHAFLGGAIVDGEQGPAIFQGANLVGAHLTGTHFTGVDLTNANLDRALLAGSTFAGADLTGASLGTYLRDSDLTGAIGVDLSKQLSNPPVPKPVPCS
ncbi:pentapeptide repeat-containing protein [Phytohabitans rumicis]|uniref:pentapeptide repeat-containing protein n=1 Tax=Phytohabitans rumicis TaxID=1076125 RepID=UPI0031E77751